MVTVEFSLIPGQVVRRLSLDGSWIEFVVRQASPGHPVQLRSLATEQVITLPWSTLAVEAMTGKAQLPRPPHRVKPRVVLWEELSSEVRERISRRVEYVNAVIDLWPRGPRCPVFQQSVVERSAFIRDPKPPSPHSVYRWLRRYIQAGHDVDALAQDKAIVRRRSTGLAPEVREVIAKALLEKLHNPGATLRGVHDQVLESAAKALRLSAYRSLSGKTVYLQGHSEARPPREPGSAVTQPPQEQ